MKNLRHLAILAFAAFTTLSWNDTYGQSISSPELPKTQAIDAPPQDRLFGDWDGLLTRLAPQGIQLRAFALTEFAGNVDGGTRQGATFANQIGIGLDINWERLAGVTGLSTHVIIVNRSGSNDSR